MSFEQFFETYPIADWILNVFKTLSPTLIALLTIWINSRREKNKEKRLIEKEDTYEKKKFSEKAILDMNKDILELNSMIWDMGSDLLEAIQRSTSKKEHDEYFNNFYTKIKKFLVFLRKVNGKADIYLASTGINKFAFNECFELLSTIEKSFVDIYVQTSNNIHSCSNIKQLNNIYDRAQQEFILLSTKLEDTMILYCVNLYDELKSRNI